MTILKTDAVLTSQAAALTALIDASGPAAYLSFQTAADAEVARIVFGDPSFGSPVAGLATLNASTADTDADGSASPITKFIIFNGAGTEIYRGSATITAGGGDIELTAVIVGAGSTVTLTSYTYQEA